MQVKHNKLNNRRGFSLIEVLIAIAIVLAIGGLVVVNLMPRRDQAKIDLQVVQFDEIGRAMDGFNLDLDRYPTDDEGLEALWKKDALEDEADQTRWKGAYLSNPILKDQWGSDLTYTASSEKIEGRYEIISNGPDREEGTDDDITSLSRFLDEEGEAIEDFDLPPADLSGE